MIKVENVDVWGFEHAVRGMRNPMNSWDKSDSIKCYANANCPGICNNNLSGWCIGNNDIDLMKRLYKAGTEHRTYARMIQVSMDIIAPLYWWKEMDRYTVGKSQVSCSTMHKIHSKIFEPIDFSHDYLYETDKWGVLDIVIAGLNVARDQYLETKDKKYWYQMIQLLPSSYNQKRTICMSYETVFKIIKERANHKLNEWVDFVDILKMLPYVYEITEDIENED